MPAQGNFFVSEGTSLSMDDGGKLILENTHLINQGEFHTGQSELYIRSAIEDVHLEGKPFEVTNLSIYTTECRITLLTSIAVQNRLNIVRGILDLGAEQLSLGEAQGRISGETNENRIIASAGGEVTKTLDITNANRINPGNLGLEITSNQSLGRTEIRRGHIPASLPTGRSVSRYFRIFSETPVSQDIQLKFYFLDAEKNEHRERQQLWKKRGNRWSAMRTEVGNIPSDQSPLWVSASDFELAERYIVGPEQQLEETTGTIPSAFTPNADGVNDFFEIPWIQHYPDAQVSIFDRWGGLIMQKKAYHRNPWNGQQHGKQLPSSTFYYIIQFSDGRPDVKGKISIVR
jgi:gliding motility-associated-like protein